MGIDITALTTNADKLGECIDKNKKQEQDRKDEQLYGIIERKVKKEEHKREKPRGQDGTLKKCKRLFEKDASPEVLTKLEESLREQEKYYRYYVQCFLPVLDKAIERSKKISNETKERVKQAISEITYNSRYCFTHNRRDSETESGYSSDVEDDHEVEISNEITNNNALLLKAIKNGNNRKFRKYLKDCTDISSIKAEEGKNILHLIASLEKKQKCKFLGTLIKTVTKEDLAQLVDSENQDEKTPLQVALINKVTKEKHESNTIRSNDNTLKFLTKLLEHGASSDNLELSTKELQNLKEEQKTYYRNFLEKLAEQGKKSKLKPEIRINTEAKIKEIIPHTINTPDSNDNYLLHPVIKNSDKKLFKELLEKGADISLKDTDGNNALHLIVKPETKQKLELLNILLEAGQKEQFIKAVNDKNKEGQTPLYQLLQRIQEKSKEPSLKNKIKNVVKKEFKDTGRYKTLELFLQNGADITVQDKDEKNALHYIASFKGEQKVACLKLTLGKDEFSKAINAVNGKEQTPLHQLLQHIKEKNEDRSCTDRKFEKTNRYKALELFLQNGADITVQDKDEKNALHYIALLKGEQKVTCLELISNKDDAVNTTNKEGQTPLHQVLQRIQEKSKEPSLKNKIKNVIKKEFKDTGRYKTLELFLQNGADITVQDKDGKNALHYIASFKGEQKVTCLELILGLVKNGTISKDKLGKAINAKNGEGNTPLELALKKKAEKRSIEHLLQGTIFDTATAYDNTTKFCTMLLEIGADPCSLELKDPKFHTKKYYLTLRDLKDYSGTPQKAQEKAKELKEKLEEKYHCGTASKKCKSGIKKLGSAIKKTGSAVAGFIDPAKRTRELLAITITITVIAMVTFAFFQGQMAIGAAIPIIATAGVICLTLTLGFSGIKKLFEKSTNKAQDTFNDKNRSNSTTEQNQASKNLVNNDQQNLRNETKNQAVQESPNQSEHTESPPDTKMSAISIMNSLKNCVGIV
ncbi:ankyrin repeat domain-containing protein [Wolbachia endosymbiont (group A) of Acrocera orbiculus]|uniref:ankyrin repeat domain-containing protein n=1 Tax=Wolbachia endosymbiont (group A) of Acrocera orbiculus TaxID=2953971 RepID=UPI002227F961|nr:ankyrin repeat domain-containing protein [Wolbachia endosymbiont (group A) of Acrocera orbiculus]